MNQEYIKNPDRVFDMSMEYTMDHTTYKITEYPPTGPRVKSEYVYYSKDAMLADEWLIPVENHHPMWT